MVFTVMKNVKLVGTFSVNKKQQKCKPVALEMGVGVINWPFNYRQSV